MSEFEIVREVQGSKGRYVIHHGDLEAVDGGLKIAETWEGAAAQELRTATGATII